MYILDRRLLNIQSRLSLNMLLIQLSLENKSRKEDTNSRHARIKNPHIPQTPSKGLSNSTQLRRIRNEFDRLDTRSSRIPRHLSRHAGRHTRSQQAGLLLAHTILEDNAANHDRGSSCHVANEADCGRRRRRILLGDHGLDSDDGCLEEESGAETTENLVPDYLADGGSHAEVDVQPVPDGHQY